ncbi:decarboxylating 6-phosphogluconate dehydrogenase [bacterium]|nr:decarboxylating 6-phosphogluconate dehydrogenase [bacterium]
MEIGFIGLGKMGYNMVKRLCIGGHVVFGADRSGSKKSEIEKIGASWVDEFSEFSRKLKSPRVVWIMVPSGEVTETVINSVSNFLSSGDILIDGGNSHYLDSIRRANEMSEKEIGFVDVGTSGGVWGLENGYCMMVGGVKHFVDVISPILTTLAPPDGWKYLGESGSGHFVKMVHNAIEYGMMQSFAEGFELMEHSGFNLDLGKIARLWNQGSVIRSWLCELSETVFFENPKLENLQGKVEESGECRWAIEAALEKKIPTPVFASSLFSRFSSKNENAFSNRFLASLRNKFGGHSVIR